MRHKLYCRYTYTKHAIHMQSKRISTILNFLWWNQGVLVGVQVQINWMYQPNFLEVLTVVSVRVS